MLEYDGGRFSGWARQPGLRTIQDEVERALCVILRLETVRLTVAGRTDAGVHAWGQVASYSGPPVSLRSLNALLPSDVAALSCVAADDGFDARRDATSRAYCYRVLLRRPRSVFDRGRALWWPRRLDVDALRACAAALVGVHDFTAFTPTQTEHVRFTREVYAAYWRGGRLGALAGGGVGAGELVGAGGVAGAGEGAGAGEDVLEFWIEADAFMRHMIRVLIGTMLEVGGGRRTVASFQELLTGRPRSCAGRTAPARGLYFAGAGYGGERVLRGGAGGG